MSAYLTIGEVKDLLKVSERTVRRWISTGELPALKIGRSVRIREEDINSRAQSPSRTFKNREVQLEVLKKARQLRTEIREQHGQPTDHATDILNNIRQERAHAR